MNSDLILTKLTSLQRCINRIKTKTPEHVEELLDDLDLQDIIALNLERTIQISVDIASHIIASSDEVSPTTMADSFSTLNKMGVLPDDLTERLRKSIGFRNISVHEYDRIDWEIVFSIITQNISDFSQFAKCVLERE